MTAGAGVETVDAVVIGAGAVGLAIARALSLAGLEVLILESNDRHGLETSSRNSEVIHAGLYYPAGSLKASLCVSGRERLYAFCLARAVSHRRIGKLIFATSEEQEEKLDAIEASARAAGVDDLVRLGPQDVTSRQPGLACTSALFSPSTGIISSHDYMNALLGEAEANGALFVGSTRVERIERQGATWFVRIAGEREPVVASPIVINAAGLGAQRLARATDGLEPHQIPPLHLAKGVYFTCARKLPVRHLLYPVPVPGGLGTHLTLDLQGQARFGPDVEWIGEIDYSVDPERHASFLAAARLICPELQAEDLVPGYAGIRPKITGPEGAAGDFVIATPATHGLEGLVNLFGIESPGLTSSLAIADHVATALGHARHG